MQRDGAVAENSIAAATAVVGYDLLSNDINQQSGGRRRIGRAGLAGSAAALDTKVGVFIGTNKVGTLFNVATGAVLMDAHGRNIQAIVPADTEVHLYVEDAPATNPINYVVEFTPA